jgi:hypothetical protein
MSRYSLLSLVLKLLKLLMSFVVYVDVAVVCCGLYVSRCGVVVCM